MHHRWRAQQLGMALLQMALQVRGGGAAQKAPARALWQVGHHVQH